MQIYIFFLDSEIGYITVMRSPFRSAKTKVEVFHIFSMLESKNGTIRLSLLSFPAKSLILPPPSPLPKENPLSTLLLPQVKLCADIKIVKRSSLTEIDGHVPLLSQAHGMATTSL